MGQGNPAPAKRLSPRLLLPQGRVKVPEVEDRKAALPPDVREGFAFPRA